MSKNKIKMSMDLEAYDAKGLPTIAVCINGEVANINASNAEEFAETLSNMAKAIRQTEANSDIIRTDCWEDYLLDAQYKNVSTSRIFIKGDVWVINHDNIREFIKDYTSDQYSQIFTNLEEMSANGLIDRECK